jgi:hypothetical protein
VQITQADLIQNEIIVKKLLQARNHNGNAEYLPDRPFKKHDATDHDHRDNSRGIGNHSGREVSI